MFGIDLDENIFIFLSIKIVNLYIFDYESFRLCIDEVFY